MRRKLNTTLCTSVDRETVDRLMDEMEKYVPYESLSSMLRLSILIMLGIGLDNLARIGLFTDNSPETFNKFIKEVNKLWSTKN